MAFKKTLAFLFLLYVSNLNSAKPINLYNNLFALDAFMNNGKKTETKYQSSYPLNLDFCKTEDSIDSLSSFLSIDLKYYIGLVDKLKPSTTFFGVDTGLNYTSDKYLLSMTLRD